jgi:hypothetical protein
MKKLLYIGRPNLGENLFATPCLDLLSREYEITFLTPGHTLPVFTQYPFLKRVLPGCNHGDPNSQLPLITKTALNNILKDGDWQYAYHHDDDVLFLQNYPEILRIKRFPVLHDKEIDINSNTHNSNRFLSRTKKYMLKLQLMSLEQTLTYDCTVRRTGITLQNSINNTVIVYQGSKECLRKLPIETIKKFIKFLPDATYLVTQETAIKLQLDKNNIKHLLIWPFNEDTLKNIVRLFETQPKVMIGPDSGLTQLASGYKIPLIWLQSRIVLENVIDASYKKYCKVYLRPNLTCKQDCIGCLATKALKTNLNSYGLFEVKENHKSHKNLDCFINKTPDCLQYFEEEIKEIISLIK